MHWWQIKKRHADLERELRSDLELEEEEQRENGVATDKAGHKALRAFGNVTLIREQTHEAWGWARYERLLQDMRFAVRQLIRTPGFTVTAVLLLCLGIGAVTAIFSLVEATLLRPLPYKDGKQLVELARTSPQSDHPVAVSGANFLDWRQRSHIFSAMAAYAGSRMTRFDPSSGAEMVHGMRVSPGFFSSVLQVRPQFGRDFRLDEDQPQSSRVVMLSHAVAERWFGNAGQAVGRLVWLDSQPFAVIGVLPERFRFELTSTADLWVPASIRPNINRGSNEWAVLGRMSEGVSISQAQTEMDLIGKQLGREFPKENAEQRIEVVPYLNWMNRGGNDRLALIFFAAVLLVLLISLANLAGLIVARYRGQSKQIALRMALGASRARIIRMLLAENLTISFLGGLAGVGLAFALTSVFRTRLSVVPLLRIDLIRIDGAALAFALALSLLTAVLFGLWPALSASRPDLNSGLKQGSIAAAGHHSQSRSRSVLIVVEIALSLVLVTGAGLLLRSLVGVLATDPGYDSQHVLTFWMMPPQQRYPTNQSLNGLYDAILERVAAIPGVQSAAISNTLPPMGNEVDCAFIVENHPPHEQKNAPTTILDTVSPGFFSTLKIPVIYGRPFSEEDNHPTSPKSVIVSQALAQHYLPGENPIGQHLKFDADGWKDSWTIIGVVADTRYFGWDHDEGIFCYFPFAVLGGRDRVGLALRTEIDPNTMSASVEQAVWSLERDLPLFDIASMNRKVSDSIAPRRFNVSLLVSFAAIAILLAGIGIFGLLANLVAQRRREIGVRMALGAQRRDVVLSILARSSLLALCGIGIGLPISLLGGKVLRGLLYGTVPSDPVILSLAAAIMFMVALLASYLPARRAASVDPVQELRAE
jgi:predicted permease